MPLSKGCCDDEIKQYVNKLQMILLLLRTLLWFSIIQRERLYVFKGQQKLLCLAPLSCFTQLSYLLLPVGSQNLTLRIDCLFKTKI